MNKENRKTITLSMILYELRNVTGNPFVHIFGIGMPVLMSILITRIAIAEMTEPSIVRSVSTSVFLGIGALIPMATIMMGYAVQQAQELEKGIPERLNLFGIKNRVMFCNRAVSETIFMVAAFLIYFLVGVVFLDLEMPVFSGAVCYIVCILIFSIFCFMLACDRVAFEKIQRYLLRIHVDLLCLYDPWRDDGDELRKYAEDDAGGGKTASGHLYEQGFLYDMDRKRI